MTLTLSGPLFDGRALGAIDRYETEVTAEVADRGEDLVRSELGTSLRHPTGHYMSRIASTVTPTHARVHDSGVIYGPWLEGVSRRNQSTRFKGYAAFRRTTQQLSSESSRIAERILPRLIREMGG